MAPGARPALPLAAGLLLLTVSGLCTSAPVTRPVCQDGPSAPRNRVDTSERLRRLREVMADPRYNIDAYIVPMDDEHQSEYVSPHDARIRFISGFSGSSGLAVVTKDKAALWTDGRYFLQADQEMDCNWELMRNGTEPKPPSEVQWLISELSRGSSVGADPRLMPAKDWLHVEGQLRGEGMQMKLAYENLIDLIWTEGRPPLSEDPIVVHNLTYAGKTWEKKVAEVRDYMTEVKVEVLLVSALDEVAWLFNLRGNDIPHTPVFKGYAVIDQDSVHLWVDLDKLTDEVKQHLKTSGCEAGNMCVTLHSYEEVLHNFGTFLRQKWKGKILLPEKSTFIDSVSFSFYNQVPSAKLVFIESPIVRMKGRKNEVEIEGMKAANKRDSVALCEFLGFMEEEIQAGREWDEISAAEKLKEYRAQQSLFRGISFETISAFGSNGAVIHYAPTNDTKLPIDTSSTYLLDSGGQYLDGTTDVTRTMHYGRPTEFQKEAYTRVLMGSIDLATSVVTRNTLDTQMVIVVRQPLFRVGLSYRHGSGHGIGSYLGIHEGPINISFRNKMGHAFELGQFFSDEPGYYEDGEFGIRLETILFVKEANTTYNFDGPYMTLEPVTLVPFERDLIVPELMNVEQMQWLNDYHRRVELEVGSILKEEDRQRAFQWLTKRQYLDGTTDVTRTMHYGRPTEFQKEAYTRVLMGAIDLADLIVNSKTADIQMSLIARQPLYRAGLSYRHGTGHGIGSYLAVHEGPTLVSAGRRTGHLVETGQFFSDEPGYYDEGGFGIRLETILLVTEATTQYNFDGPYMKFEPVTLVPFEKNMIIPEIMSRRQLQWLNDYHRRVELEVGSILKEEDRQRALQWLTKRTAPIHRAEVAPSVDFTRQSAGGSTVAPVWLSLLALAVARAL